MYLAENLKFLREQNGKTQGELAVLFGIEQKTISSWECGSRKPPIGTIVSLAKLYRVSLDDLVLTDMRQLYIQVMCSDYAGSVRIISTGETRGKS